MNLCILRAWTVARINGELKHVEAVVQQFLSEGGIVFAVFLGFGGQIKKHQNPHDTVFAKSVQHLHFRKNHFLGLARVALVQRVGSGGHGNHQRTTMILNNHIDHRKLQQLGFDRLRQVFLFSVL